MSLFNPYVLLGIFSTIFVTFLGGYYKGSEVEKERQQVEIARLNQEARETEQRMAAMANTYAQTLRKANDAAKTKENKLRSDLASGDRKLYVPVTTTCGVSTTADSPAPSGNTETRAELDGRVAQALVDLTSRGDQAIRSLNACIEIYDEMRSKK